MVCNGKRSQGSWGCTIRRCRLCESDAGIQTNERVKTGEPAMIELLRLFTDIALMRRGPQDLPASPVVLALTIVAFFVVQLVVGTVLPPIASHWLGNLLLEVAFTFGWYAVLLYAVKKPERFLQTSTAVFGFQIVLSPVLIAALWLQRRFDQDSIGAVGVTFISLALLIWV